MNNAAISTLYQLKVFSRFVLKLAAWAYGFFAVVMCIMISFSTLSYFEATDSIIRAVVAVAAYHLVPRAIDLIIRRLVVSKRSTR